MHTHDVEILGVRFRSDEAVTGRLWMMKGDDARYLLKDQVQELKNLLHDFFDRVDFHLSSGKLECIINDTVVQWVYVRLITSEQEDC